MNKVNSKLLTIAIPTYNRAQYLDQCLSQICKQVRKYNEYVELIVSDNCSSDDTAEVVKKHVDNANEIVYIRNEENIGMDNNFIRCFLEARGKYVWIFGDDDVLLDGALQKIIDVLSSGEYGDVYLNSYSFTKNYEHEKPNQINRSVVIYDSKFEFFQRVTYWITFISSNIVNKSLFDRAVDRAVFQNTYLLQLSWILPSILGAKKNVVMNEYLIAAKANNSGGYGLCHVFGKNLNKLMQYFEPYGMRIEFVHFINNDLLLTFFPGFILLAREERQSFHDESFYKQLFGIFNKYFLFWLIVAPICVLPIKIAWLWYLPFRVFNKLNRLRKE